MEQLIIELLRKASDAYYNTENFYEATPEEVDAVCKELNYNHFSVITDEVFDEIYYRAKQKYSLNPYFLSVGSEVRTGKVKLPIPLGSMTEVKEGELEKWLVPSHYCISAKLDGCSCLLVYENGKLKIAYSRGDGYSGQDITRTVKQLLGVKDTLNEEFTGYVRGEIIIPKDNIQKCIDELREETKKEYKNGRNLTAGQLNAETADKAFIKYAHFVAYNINGWEGETHRMFDKLTDLGFITPFHMMSDNVMMTDDYMRELIAKLKFGYIYEVDGVIATMEVPDDDHQGFETGTLNPKCSRKIKFGLKDFNTKECEVLGIKWQIGKNYKFTPVLQITPVELNGATVSNVTGHNFKFLVENNIRVGSKGLVTRAGDVIPYWLKTLDDKIDMSGIIFEDVLSVFDDEGLNEYWNLPLNAAHLEIDGVDLALGDTAAEDGSPFVDDCQIYLDEAQLQQTLYFCTKLGVEFGGYGNISALSNEIGHPISWENLVTIQKEVFEGVIGVNGLKFHSSLHEKVVNATPTQLADATGCFGEGIGELKLNKIVEKYGELPFDRQKVLDTEGWAEKSTEQYMSKYVKYVDMVEFLQENYMWKGFTIIETTGDKCKDIKVVFTGIRSAEMEDVIRKNGGRVLSSFTKECNLVIAKDPLGNSGKLQKAKEKGVEVISLEEAFERFGHKEEKKVDLATLDNPLANALKG